MTISCEKAALICNKTQYREATFMEKMKLKFHLLLCKNCPAFSKRNTKLTALCQKANLHSLTLEDKRKMKAVLKEGS
ncbi:hypothetical protein [Pricia sp.]|uniref:hypothetical protein n=1 Tax=Pricia sp. TaxID=2268138 RepID=UPI00359376E6